MTHQPPVPEAAQSPYPLQQPAQTDSATKPPVATRKAAASPLLGLSQLLGLGAALVGSAALATWYYRREPAPAAAKPRRRATSPDAARVSGKQPYEVSYFARKHGISADAARAIITEAGPSREKANALAKERAGA